MNAPTNTGYSDRFLASAALAQRAEQLIASGVNHDSYLFQPFPLYFERADGPWKWNADGHRCVDFWIGHGALLCGHAYPPVVEALQHQLRNGTHLGGPHPGEVAWAEAVVNLVPSAERVRFVASGTEATLLAFRVARAWTGRTKIIKFDGGFHGWHDESMARFVAQANSGLHPNSADHIALVSPFDLSGMVQQLDAGDVAAVVIEPGGPGTGAVPLSREFLQELRRLTTHYGCLLIFDEVVSGFRYAPGGAQQLFNVTPDLTTLGKILAGGLPGAALAGRADIMAVFGNGLLAEGRDIRTPHTGTFNANPLAAAAGAAMLTAIAGGAAQTQARVAATQLANAINEIAQHRGLDAAMHTYNSSVFHLILGANALGIDPDQPGASLMAYGRGRERYLSLRKLLLQHGVDSHPMHGWLSAAHNDEALDQAIYGFRKAFADWRP